MDPRDRIFALVGLLDQEARQKIEIDYSLDKNAVYQKATLALLRQGDALLFHFLNGNIRDSVLPTWCIDFSRGRCGPPHGASYFSGSLPGERELPLESWAKHVKILGHNIDLGTLSLEGCSVGIIQNLVPSKYGSLEDAEEFTAEQQLCERLVSAFLFTFHAMKTFTRTFGPKKASARILRGDVWKTIANGRTISDLIFQYSLHGFSLQDLGDNGFSYLQSLAIDLVPNFLRVFVVSQAGKPGCHSSLSQ